MHRQPLNNELFQEYQESPETDRVHMRTVPVPHPKRKQELNLYLLCINCQNHIEILKADSHSLTCINPTASVRNLDYQSESETLKFKLLKLKNLFDLSLTTKKLTQSNNLNIRSLQLILKQILEQDQFTPDEQLLHSLSSFISNLEEDLWIKLLAERLFTLLMNLAEAVHSQQDSLPYETKAVRYNKQITELKEQVNRYKRRSLILKNICLKTQPKGKLSQILDSVNSDLGSPSVPRSSLSSTNTSPEPNSAVFEFSSSESELKKYFYSIYLTHKIRLVHQKQKIENFSISRLYNHALFKRIPPENWPSFISEQFNSPEFEFVESPVRKIRRNRSKQLFESIVEEETVNEIGSADD